MNLYWAYQRSAFHPLGRHASWDDAANYADGARPGWHTIVDAGELIDLYTQVGTQLGQRVPAQMLYVRVDAYLTALDRLVEATDSARRAVTSARAQLDSFIRQYAKGPT
jgi:hypothetical protein